MILVLRQSLVMVLDLGHRAGVVDTKSDLSGGMKGNGEGRGEKSQGAAPTRGGKLRLLEPSPSGPRPATRVPRSMREEKAARCRSGGARALIATCSTTATHVHTRLSIASPFPVCVTELLLRSLFFSACTRQLHPLGLIWRDRG